jgi:hypothetical protein
MGLRGMDTPLPSLKGGSGSDSVKADGDTAGESTAPGLRQQLAEGDPGIQFQPIPRDHRPLQWSENVTIRDRSDTTTAGP